MYEEVKALLIKFGADQKAIESLRERSEDELQKIRNTYIITQPVPKPPYSKEVITKKNLPHPNHKNTNL